MLSLIKKLFLGLLLIGVLAAAAFKLWFYLASQDIPTEIGQSVAARPMPTITEPSHPYLNEPQRSSMHGGAYNRDLNSFPGPLGINTKATHRSFSAIVGVAPKLILRQ